jgi:hypothetical protein
MEFHFNLFNIFNLKQKKIKYISEYLLLLKKVSNIFGFSLNTNMRSVRLEYMIIYPKWEVVLIIEITR